jgi:hypothetical protein
MNQHQFLIGQPGVSAAAVSKSLSNIAHHAFLVLAALLLVTMSSAAARAQVNGVGKLPDLGWGSWTQEVMFGEGWATEANIKAQSDALKASGLQSHGYVFINIDSGWQSGFDEYGRPTANPALFPDGMAATVQYIHNNGQKASIYWVPGVQSPVYSTDGNIQGTSYPVDSIVETGVPGNAFSYGTPCCNFWHMKIDFTKPGSQQYVNSIVNLFASWGFDAIKLDGVTPGSDDDNLIVDNRPDVQAWSQAIAQSSRPMELTISWALDHDYLSTWQKYANARRIEDDVNCYCTTETQWPDITRLFADLVTWQGDSGPALGWNDLDSLLVGNGTVDGLTNDERQSAMTLWAISNSPMIIGDDLTQLDTFGQQLLSNDKVIAVDQSGAPATQITGGNNPVLASPKLPSGSHNVALFNLNSSASSTAVTWTSLGITGSADVYDLWNDKDLGNFQDSYSAALNSHASALLQITPLSAVQIPAPPAGLTATAGSAQVVLSWTASTGASSYNIYRSTTSGSEIQISTGVTATSFTDTGLTNGTKYFYQVTAVDSAGESGMSSEVTATPKAQAAIPSAPTSLSATAGNGQVVLSWTASSGATSYNIYRGTSSGDEATLTTGVTTAGFTDTGVTNATTYFYEVTAVNSTGESAKSSEVSATPTTGFSISATPTSLSLTGTSGQAISVLTVTPNGDAGTLSFSCSNLPAAYACSFSPSPLSLSGLSAPQKVTMTVSSESASAATQHPLFGKTGHALLGALIPSCFLMGIFMPVGFRKWRRAFIALVMLAAAVGFTACGSSGGATTQPTSTTYNFQVNVTAGANVAQNLGYTLTVQ